MKYLIVCGFMLLLLQTAHGEDDDGIYIVKGAGSTSCERYVSDVESHEQMFLLGFSWIQGYLTAYNNFVFDGQDLASGVDSATIRKWLNNHCRNRPGDDLAGAANALVNTLLNPDQTGG